MVGVMTAQSLHEDDLPEFLQRFDTNDDDQIDEEERQAIRDLRAKLRKEKRESIDSDWDGRVSPKEVKAARKTIRKSIRERRTKKFLSIAGQDGMISPSEYGAIPGIEHLPDSAFETIWRHLDADGDGAISFEEFAGTLRRHESSSERFRPESSGQ